MILLHRDHAAPAHLLALHCNLLHSLIRWVIAVLLQHLLHTEAISPSTFQQVCRLQQTAHQGPTAQESCLEPAINTTNGQPQWMHCNTDESLHACQQLHAFLNSWRAWGLQQTGQQGRWRVICSMTQFDERIRHAWNVVWSLCMMQANPLAVRAVQWHAMSSTFTKVG